jgi:hypothetical protein
VQAAAEQQNVTAISRIRSQIGNRFSVCAIQRIKLTHFDSHQGLARTQRSMKTDDIISYHQLVTEEQINLQKGMNFGTGKNYSILLMSVRDGAPYDDAFDELGDLIYEGHDIPRTAGCIDPKVVDQPMQNPGGSWTENGKFFQAAINYKTGLKERAELVKVYEKIVRGVWCYKGVFELIDARIVESGNRKIFKFYLHPIEKTVLRGIRELPHNRIIPTTVKVEVWQRDRGKCVLCGSDKNLHYDHVIPFSKGGSSLTAENIRLLCAKHNLEKSDRILSLTPLIAAGIAASSRLIAN